MKSGIITASGREIPYRIIRRKGMRRILLSFSGKGELVMTVPRLVPSFLITSFLKKSSAWIDEHLGHIGERQLQTQQDATEYIEKRTVARVLIEARVRELATEHGFRYRNISIRNQRTRFGSCSRSGNLSFHYRIAFFSPEERDYVIFHELCHLRHFDHSPAFWQEVARFVPDYVRIRRNLSQRSHTGESSSV